MILMDLRIERIMPSSISEVPEGITQHLLYLGSCPLVIAYRIRARPASLYVN